LQTESALYHDAVRIFASTIRQLDKSEEIIPIRNSCRHPNPWRHGLRIVNFMKVMNITESSKSEHPLITGQLAFNDAGQRIQFHLEVVELNAQGFKKIATWSSNDEEGKLHYTRSSQEVEKQIFESLKNKHFKVASRLGPPFLIQR
jgi:glutamate receptor, ionotropic, invertebrate